MNWKNVEKVQQYRKEYRKKHTDKIRDWNKLYYQSLKGKESLKRYSQSLKGNATIKRYRQSFKGKKTIKLCAQKHKALMRYSGDLTIQTIQLVYEDNVKKFGRLTCYLCLKPIEFGQDSLEHKVSSSKGGTNEYNNLAIAHLSCNKKKFTKTDIEYRKDHYGK